MAIIAQAFPIYDDGRSGDAFATSEAISHQEAVQGIAKCGNWPRYERDPAVVRIDVVTEELLP